MKIQYFFYTFKNTFAGISGRKSDKVSAVVPYDDSVGRACAGSREKYETRARDAALGPRPTRS